ncbi:MAG: ATP synthase F1 subunit delta [Clostridia bacterium]|nr:ATP synthase F1 subunit delta [Clostridia bacterium]
MADLSKEYASALFSLAYEKEILDRVKKELVEIESALDENEGYLEILASPAIALSIRHNLIDEAFGKSCEYVVSFLKLMCENGHIASLNDCIKEFGLLCRELENRVIATIYYAFELSPSQKEKLKSKLKAITKKEIEPVYIEDKGLIGGIKIELDGKVLDGSLINCLNNIKGVIG